jgi:hypothetical protein
MRRIASAAGVLLLLGTACLSEARAQFGGDKFKESSASDSYTRGYLEVFGRPPLPKESQYWRKQQMPYSQMINEMKAWLRKPEGAKDLSETIERSYQNSFGRAPTADELAYWQSEVKAKHYGYTHIVEHSRTWLKGGGADERVALIKRAYERAFGRSPTAKEIDYWREQVRDNGTNYSELVEKCIDWMLGREVHRLDARQQPGADRRAEGDDQARLPRDEPAGPKRSPDETLDDAGGREAADPPASRHPHPEVERLKRSEET